MATVLIVEDQEQILILAQSFLEEQGHKTLSAATADEALAILTGSEAVDALFVDIILNGDMQAGIELAKRAVELKPRLKVVYSTGLSVTDGMKALFVPGSAVLEKPYTVDQLLTSFQCGCCQCRLRLRTDHSPFFLRKRGEQVKMSGSTSGPVCQSGPTHWTDADQSPISAYSVRGQDGPLYLSLPKHGPPYSGFSGL